MDINITSISNLYGSDLDLIYTYHNLKGTILQLCYIFRKDQKHVIKLINKYHCFETAMDLSPRIIPNDYTIDSNRYNITAEQLSEEDHKLINKYYYMIENIAKSKNCNDEDIISDTFVYLCYCVNKWTHSTKNIPISTYLSIKITRFILTELRSKIDNLEHIKNNACDIDDITINTIDDFIEEYNQYEMKNAVNKLFDTLTNHYKTILRLRYGFDPSIKHKISIREAAELMKCTHDRARYIEEKALHECRKPERLKIITGYLDHTAYDDYLKRQNQH